ncbi:MAG: xanthine dehydrogenase family protein subunit M [Pseudomonadales bacterium]|jgi:carbon-monoxide dehydrogenase medium subunit|nr:xanthine dehydrogenase family protein subunit M [Pseudomonadales bacterium]
MYSFDYHKPSALTQALEIFQGADDPIFLAGGMTLIPTMKQRLAAPTDVIDLADLDELRGISLVENGLSIGALTTHNEVATHPLVVKHLPVLAELASTIGDNQVRNRGTIGGSLANSDPAADYPAALIGLGGSVVTPSRKILGDDFFLDLFETALEPCDLIVRIEFPLPDRAAYAKFRNQASGYAVVGALVADFQGRIRVGITGAGPCACRAIGIEDQLMQNLSVDVLDLVEVPDAGFNSDIHASAEYRAHLVKVLTKRALRQMLGE